MKKAMIVLPYWEYIVIMLSFGIFCASFVAWMLLQPSSILMLSSTQLLIIWITALLLYIAIHFKLGKKTKEDRG